MEGAAAGVEMTGLVITALVVHGTVRVVAAVTVMTLFWTVMVVG